MTIERTKSSLSPWTLVERSLEEVRERNRICRTRNDFAAVGHGCAEVFFLLIYAIYVADRRQDVKAALEESTLDHLKRCIAHRLGGPSRDAAVAGLNVVSSHQIAGIANAEAAAECLAATESVVRYLSIAAGRRPSTDTVKDVCERFTAKNPGLGKSQLVTLLKVARSPIGQRVASELTEEDLFDHARRRREDGISGATISQDISYLRGAFIAAGNLAISVDVIDRAKAALRKAGLVTTATVRDRRPTREELQRLVKYFETPNKRGKRREMPMADIIDFALWTARRIGEICDLRWDDLDEKKVNCRVRVSDARGRVREHWFPLLGKARDIIMRQTPKRGDPRIFPYNSQSASAAYTRAKKAIGIENLRFQDLRREAAARLHESGHSVEQIAKVTGRIDLNSLLRDIGARPPESPDTDGEEPALALTAKAQESGKLFN